MLLADPEAEGARSPCRRCRHRRLRRPCRKRAPAGLRFPRGRVRTGCGRRRSACRSSRRRGRGDRGRPHATNRFDENDAALLELVADRAALAIRGTPVCTSASTRSSRRSTASAARRACRSCRGSRSPRYLPGGADVGGDWYDEIALDEEGVGLAMGDVVGHGIEAAALMGELPETRFARIALEGLSPGELVDRLDRLVPHPRATTLATLVYAVIDSDWTQVRFACAGHPPLLLGSDGRAEFLWDGRWGSGHAPARRGDVSPRGRLDAPPLHGRAGGGARRGAGRAGAGASQDRVPRWPRRARTALRSRDHRAARSRGAKDDVALPALRTMDLPADRIRLDLPTAASLRHVRRMLARWLTGEKSGGAREIQLRFARGVRERDRARLQLRRRVVVVRRGRRGGPYRHGHGRLARARRSAGGDLTHEHPDGSRGSGRRAGRQPRP